MNYDSILRQCDFLSLERNPVLANECDLLIALGQDSGLPFKISEMLGIASDRTTQWPAVSAELALNRTEELGSETGGIPHVDILVSGVRRELGVDLQVIEHTDETSHFLGLLRDYLTTATTAEVSGAVFALEASAIPELEVLGKIIEDAKSAVHLRDVVSQETNEWLSMSLADFIKIHTNGFEVAHRKRLWLAVRPYLSDHEAQDEFNRGFLFVLKAMGEWWNSMLEASS